MILPLIPPPRFLSLQNHLETCKGQDVQEQKLFGLQDLRSDGLVEGEQERLSDGLCLNQIAHDRARQDRRFLCGDVQRCNSG